MANLSAVPFFSVVIPTFERNDLLAKCLECLTPDKQKGMGLVGQILKSEEQEAECKSQETALFLCPGSNDSESRLSASGLSTFPTYEVIVSDDGRTTTAEAMLRERFPWARWVPGPGKGPAGNRNAGATEAKGEWLVFTDDDCLPQSGWLKAFSNALTAAPDKEVFEGNILPDRPRRTLAEHAPVGGGGGNLWSCNFAIRRSLFLELGGFDSQFRVCMEDSDFAQRVRNSGKIFPFLEDAVVIHPWRPRTLNRDGWKSNEAEVADHLRFRRKHPGNAGIVTSRILRLALRILWRDICFVLKHGDWRGAQHAFAGFCHTTNVALQYRALSSQK
jgi:GT2 family glycosyltransferase